MICEHALKEFLDIEVAWCARCGAVCKDDEWRLPEFAAAFAGYTWSRQPDSFPIVVAGVRVPEGVKHVQAFIYNWIVYEGSSTSREHFIQPTLLLAGMRLKVSVSCIEEDGIHFNHEKETDVDYLTKAVTPAEAIELLTRMNDYEITMYGPTTGLAGFINQLRRR